MISTMDAYIRFRADAPILQDAHIVTYTGCMPSYSAVVLVYLPSTRSGRAAFRADHIDHGNQTHITMCTLLTFNSPAHSLSALVQHCLCPLSSSIVATIMVGKLSFGDFVGPLLNEKVANSTRKHGFKLSNIPGDALWTPPLLQELNDAIKHTLIGPYDWRASSIIIRVFIVVRDNRFSVVMCPLTITLLDS